MSLAAGDSSSPTIGTLATSCMFSPSPVIGWGSGGIAAARRPGAVQLAAWAVVGARAPASSATSSGRRFMRASDAYGAGNLRSHQVGSEGDVGPGEAQDGDALEGQRVGAAAVLPEGGMRAV